MSNLCSNSPFLSSVTATQHMWVRMHTCVLIPVLCVPLWVCVRQRACEYVFSIQFETMLPVFTYYVLSYIGHDCSLSKNKSKSAFFSPFTHPLHPPQTSHVCIKWDIVKMHELSAPLLASASLWWLSSGISVIPPSTALVFSHPCHTFTCGCGVLSWLRTRPSSRMTRIPSVLH